MNLLYSSTNSKKIFTCVCATPVYYSRVIGRHKTPISLPEIRDIPAKQAKKPHTQKTTFPDSKDLGSLVDQANEVRQMDEEE